MTTFDQELTGRYVAGHAELGARRVAGDVFVRDTIRTLYNADKKLAIDPADNGSLAELVEAAEEHLVHIANDVSQRPVATPPATRGDTT